MKSLCSGLQTTTRANLVHERRVGHENSQVNVDRCHQAAFQLILSKLHRINIVKLQDQTVDWIVIHLLSYSGVFAGVYSNLCHTLCFLRGRNKQLLPARFLQTKSIFSLSKQVLYRNNSFPMQTFNTGRLTASLMRIGFEISQIQPMNCTWNHFLFIQ